MEGRGWEDEQLRSSIETECEGPWRQGSGPREAWTEELMPRSRPAMPPEGWLALGKVQNERAKGPSYRMPAPRKRCWRSSWRRGRGEPVGAEAWSSQGPREEGQKLGPQSPHQQAQPLSLGSGSPQATPAYL